MQQFDSKGEEIFFNLSATVLRFEYLIPIVLGLVLATLLINYLLIRSKKKGAKKFEVTAIESKPVNKSLIFFKDILKYLLKGLWFFWNVIVVSSFVGALYYTFWIPPWIVKTTPAFDGNWSDFKKPVVIEFSGPVNPDKLKMHMSPEIPGKWEYVKVADQIPLVRKVQFTPKETIFADQHVVIYLTGIAANGESRKGYETDVEFDVPELPTVEKIVPEMNAERVQVEQNIELHLDRAGKDNAKWDLEIEPKLEYEIIDEDEKVVDFKFKDGLAQSTKYAVKAYRTPIRYSLGKDKVVEEGTRELVSETSFMTVKTPGVASYSPKGAGIFAEDQIIRVEFDQDLVREDAEKNFSINPDVKGKITWESDRIFVFTTEEDLKKATKYEVTFAKGIESKIEGSTQADIKFSFDTIGTVQMSGNTPSNGAASVSTGSNVYVAFNQEVDHSSAQSKFSISPSVGGTFSWNGNTMTFNPSGTFGYSTNYTVKIAKGVKTVRGLDSDKDFSFGFKTVPEKYTLNVPWYKQQHNFTCNVASARMALAYKGVYLSESTIRAGVGSQPSKANGGNPHKGWVDQYGVYWGPVASFISHYRSAEIKSGWNIQGVASEIQKGNPVILWWHNAWSPAYSLSWTATDGNTITGVNGMHSEVVYGFKGSPDNPTTFYTKDPWRGNRTYSAASFNNLWSRYFNRMAVVVR